MRRYRTVSMAIIVGATLAASAAVVHAQGICTSAPRNDCRHPVDEEKARVEIRNSELAPKDRFAWKWAGRASINVLAFGDPVTTNDVVVCLYDASAPGDPLRFELRAPAGSTCGTRPCWKATASGFKYKNPGGAGTGISGIVLKASTIGKAQVTVKAQGVPLSDAGLPAPPLATPLMVQLQVLGAGCIRTFHNQNEVVRNQPGLFIAVGSRQPPF